MQLKFLYFDLGKVIVNFSLDLMLKQVSEASGVGVEAIKSAFFGPDKELMRSYELGKISDQELYEAFCKIFGCRPDYKAMFSAINDIFLLNLPTLPIVAQLRQAGYRLGILSNTCSSHWEYCFQRYRTISENFSVYALSFRIGAMKPQAEIYYAAADLAGVAPQEIFFVDDIAENVAGAQAVGFDAIQYTTASELAVALYRRGIKFNY